MNCSLRNTLHITPVKSLSQNEIRQIPAWNNVSQMSSTNAINERTTQPDTAETVISTKDATIFLRKVFHLLGLSKPQRLRSTYTLYACIMNALVCIAFPIGFAVSYWRMLRNGLPSQEMGILLTSLQAFMNCTCCLFKVYTLTWFRSEWHSADVILERLDQHCRRTPHAEEEQRQCVRYSNRCAIFYIVAYWAYSATTLLGAVVVNRPPYSIYIPFLDWRSSRTQFAITAAIEFLLMNVACAQNAFNDSFSVIYVYILRKHMKILVLRFSNLAKDRAMSSVETLAELKQCIRHHKDYLELYDIIAPIISITIFIQFVVTAFILSTTLVNFMLIATDFYSRVGSFFYIIAIILEILPVCYYAQCLMDDSNRLAEVIFHSNWVEQDSRYRKMLVFLMQRTQCSKMLTAGKLFPVNLSCCLSIVKFSFTLYTFIKTMGLEEKFGNQ